MKFITVAFMLLAGVSSYAIEDGGAMDLGGEYYSFEGGGFGGGFGFMIDVTPVAQIGFSHEDLMAIEDLYSQVTASQRVTIVGARMIGSTNVLPDQINWSDYTRSLLMPAPELAAQMTGMVQVSTKPSARSTAAQKATAAQNRARSKAAYDKARVSAINDNPNSCTGGNRIMLRTIASEYLYLGASNSSCPAQVGQPTPSTASDFCIAWQEILNVGWQFGFNDPSYLALETAQYALKVEMADISAYAQGVLESCDF